MMREIDLVAMANRRYEESHGKTFDEYRPSPKDTIELNDAKANELEARIKFLLEDDDLKPFLGDDEDGQSLREQLILLSMRLVARRE